MALVDLDKTSYKFKDVLWFISGALLVAGGVWRFESRMNSIDDKIDSSVGALELKVMYKYELEILKINNRIDLIEAKKFVQRRDFKSDTLSVNDVKLVQGTRTDRRRDRQERHPQVCMIAPRIPEFCRKKLIPIKILLS
jgi:hypothetical protein